MLKDESVNFQIPADKVDAFIIERLVEIEARQTFIDSNIRIILGRVREKDDNYNYERFIDECNEQLRKIRLELVEFYIKKYS